MQALGSNDHETRDLKSTTDQHTAIDEIHLPLFRRPHRFVSHNTCNVSSVSEILRRQEMRYLRTSTVARDNRIVRQWRGGPLGVDEYMFDGAGLENNWYHFLTASGLNLTMIGTQS